MGKLFSMQDLVRNPLTRGSALLFRFLSPDKAFTDLFTPDTVGQVAGRKVIAMLRWRISYKIVIIVVFCVLGKKLKSVATKLRTKKEVRGTLFAQIYFKFN